MVNNLYFHDIALEFKILQSLISEDLPLQRFCLHTASFNKRARTLTGETAELIVTEICMISGNTTGAFSFHLNNNVIQHVKTAA